MNPYKRPEKETDPDKLPGQIVYRPTHMEVPLVKAVKNWCHDFGRCNCLKGRCEKGLDT